MKMAIDVKGQGQGEMSFGHRMCADMMYDFASLTFDLDRQLKAQICHFVMKLGNLLIFLHKNGNFGSDRTEITSVQFLIGRCIIMRGKLKSIFLIFWGKFFNFWKTEFFFIF